MRIAALKATQDQDDRTTIVHLTDIDPATMLSMGLIPVRPDLSEGIVGVGIARCRQEDHFDPAIGTFLATARAQVDFAEKLEERVVGMVKSERDFAVDRAGQQIVATLNQLADAVGL